MSRQGRGFVYSGLAQTPKLLAKKIALTTFVDSKTIRPTTRKSGHSLEWLSVASPRNQAWRPVRVLDQNKTTKRLRDLLPEAQFFPSASDPVAISMSDDPTAISHGSLYVHLDDCDSTGAESAAKRGASAVVAERLLPSIDAPQVIVEDIRAAKRLLESELGEDFNNPAPLIAIGGSCGRTTIAGLLASIFAHAGAPVGVYGTLGSDDGETYLPHDRLVAPSLRWRKWLRRCHLGEVSAAITTAAPGRRTPLAEGKLQADLVCLTSLRGDRLDTSGKVRWQSVVNHRAAMRRAVGPLGTQTALIANGDDPDCMAFASESPGPLFTYGETKGLDLVVTPVSEYPGGQEFMIQCGKHTACVTVSCTGAAFRNNCVAAIATALVAGIDLLAAVRGVELAPAPIGTMEQVSCGQAFPVYLDRAMRPLALRSALSAALPNGGARQVVAFRLAEDQRTAHEQLMVAQSMADRVIAWGQPAGAGHRKTTIVEDQLSAIALAVGLADEGDAVLVAGMVDHQAEREMIEEMIRRRLESEESRSAA